MAKFNQLARRVFPGMPPDFQSHYTQTIDAVNSLAGYHGEIVLGSHINLQGNRVMNVGTPTGNTDAITQEFAQSNYGAAALRPQLEANGTQPLQVGLLSLKNLLQPQNSASAEVVSGSGTHWTLANAPVVGSTPLIVVQTVSGGIVLLPGQTPGFTISGANITTTSSYSAGSLFAFYSY